MQVIIDWLNSNQDYNAGLALYLKYGISEFYKKLLAQRSDDFNRSKLKELLSALVPENCKLESPKVQVRQDHQNNAAIVEPDKRRDNERYLRLLKQKGNIYTQLNLLKSQSLFLPDGEELRKCATYILITNQKLMECWAQINYYQDNGCFPESGAEVRTPEADPKKRAQYLRQSISKCKSRLSSPNCRDKAATEKLLNERLAELAKLSPKKKKSA